MPNQKHYAIALIRVSSKKQGLQGDSPEDQLEQIQLKAKQLEVEIKEVFTFMESASGELQPSQAAIDYCKNPKNKIKYCIVKSIDRFTRGGVGAYSDLKSQLEKVGVSLIDCHGIISEYKVNTLAHLGVEYKWSVYSPSFQNEILTAERYKDEIRDIQTRMLGAAIRYIRLGFWRGSSPPGYIAEKIETTEHGKRYILKPDPVKSPWFIKMFELTALHSMSPQEIVDEINKMGFRTPLRKFRDKYDKTKIIALKGNNLLTIKKLTQYIHNPIYCGVNTEKWTNGKPVRIYGGGLVSIELWNKANLGHTYIEDNHGLITIHKGIIPPWRITKNKLNPNYPYKQYVLCSVCKKPLMASASTGKGGKKRPAYHCTRSHKSYRVKLKTFNETIMNFCLNVKFSDKFIADFEENFIKNWELRMGQIKKTDNGRQTRIAELQIQIDQISKNCEILTNLTMLKSLQDRVAGLESEMEQLKVDEFKEKQDQDDLANVDRDDVLKSLRNFMEHPEIMLLEQPDPLKNAAVFGLIFDEKPTYEDLVNGTPKLAGLFKLNDMYDNGQNPLCGTDGT